MEGWNSVMLLLSFEEAVTVIQLTIIEFGYSLFLRPGVSNEAPHTSCGQPSVEAKLQSAIMDRRIGRCHV